jgi:hypothetical protein
MGAGQVPGVHAYNPNHSGGGDQEDHSLRPASAKSETLSQNTQHTCTHTHTPQRASMSRSSGRGAPC